ncbi:arylsulfatase [Colletotrichum sojae]|uniref:Arylsulfatase n=1 Tax=Colletotrichum sojae TaxID=2175907 RepID=A0A8H6IVI1_9PEZI|nr:arylsulfatase [Colletotrichum sojae]
MPRYKDPSFFKYKPGYERYLKFRVAALAEILKAGGYHTILSGKWHLGMKKEHSPHARGFEKVFAFLKGRTEKDKEKPFFAYLSYLAPHWPLQAPKENWQKYTGQYDDGPDIEIPEDVVPAQPEGWNIDTKWEDLTDQERAESARKMEVYSGMVDAMDEGIGQVIDHLESTGELDNTFVLFMSDNGAEGVMLEALPVMGTKSSMADVINTFYDNSLDNIGSKSSFTWYGPHWVSAAT